MQDKLLYAELTNVVIGSAIEVHRALGPGLLESVYNQCLCHELSLRGISFEREKSFPVEYKGCKLDCGYCLDVLVEGKLLIELKSVEAFKEIHKAQLLSYMKLAGIRKGLLINFNVPVLKNGIKSFVL